MRPRNSGASWHNATIRPSARWRRSPRPSTSSGGRFWPRTRTKATSLTVAGGYAAKPFRLRRVACRRARHRTSQAVDSPLEIVPVVGHDLLEHRDPLLEPCELLEMRRVVGRGTRLALRFEMGLQQVEAERDDDDRQNEKPDGFHLVAPFYRSASQDRVSCVNRAAARTLGPGDSART